MGGPLLYLLTHSLLLKLDIIQKAVVNSRILPFFSLTLVLYHKKRQEEYFPISMEESMASECSPASHTHTDITN